MKADRDAEARRAAEARPAEKARREADPGDGAGGGGQTGSSGARGPASGGAEQTAGSGRERAAGGGGVRQAAAQQDDARQAGPARATRRLDGPGQVGAAQCAEPQAEREGAGDGKARTVASGIAQMASGGGQTASSMAASGGEQAGSSRARGPAGGGAAVAYGGRTRFVAHAAIIAAAYAALTVGLAPISFGEQQFRVSEALCVLPAFTPAAVPGLFVGCLISNTVSFMGLPDMIFGSLATLLAALLTRHISNATQPGRAVAKASRAAAARPSRAATNISRATAKPGRAAAAVFGRRAPAGAARSAEAGAARDRDAVAGSDRAAASEVAASAPAKPGRAAPRGDISLLRIVLIPLPAVLINAAVIGAMLAIFLGLPFGAAAFGVAIGQAGSCYGLGAPLYVLMSRLAMRGALSLGQQAGH